eukprot:6375753-Amphidinium_carterae.1
MRFRGIRTTVTSSISKSSADTSTNKSKFRSMRVFMAFSLELSRLGQPGPLDARTDTSSSRSFNATMD